MVPMGKERIEFILNASFEAREEKGDQGRKRYFAGAPESFRIEPDGIEESGGKPVFGKTC